MKKIFLLAAVLLLTSFRVETEVYLCDSKGGKKYHLAKDCKGLSNCKAEIIKVSLSEAKDRGKTLCGFED